MRLISIPVLSPEDHNELLAKQGEINALVDYQARVNLAKAKFASKPKLLFSRIRTALVEVSGELVRCGYCEDSCADEIEHVWPKNFFPDLTFCENNYLFACGICNPAKSDHFELKIGSVWVDLKEQRKHHGFIEPTSRISKFVDPLREDPKDLLWMDIVSKTFMFVPIHDVGTDEYERAKHTIDTLRLNREVLVLARKNAYSGFLDRIHRYLDCKQANESADSLGERLNELRRAPHQTVRMEINRQINSTTLDLVAVNMSPEIFL